MPCGACSLGPTKQRDGLRGEPLAAPSETEAVRGRGADGDAGGVVEAERAGELRAHLVAERREPGLLADEDAVGVDELQPAARTRA